MSFKLNGKTYSDNVIAVSNSDFYFNQEKTNQLQTTVFIKNEINGESSEFFIDGTISLPEPSIEDRDKRSLYKIVLNGNEYFARKVVSWKTIEEVFKKNGLNFSEVCNSYIDNFVFEDSSQTFKERWKDYGQQYYDLLSWSNELAKVSDGYDDFYSKEINRLKNIESNTLEDFAMSVFRRLAFDYLYYQKSEKKDLSMDDNNKFLYQWDLTPPSKYYYLKMIKITIIKNLGGCFVDRVHNMLKNNVDFEEGW